MLRALSLCYCLICILPVYAHENNLSSEVLEQYNIFFNEYSEQAYLNCLLDEECITLLHSPTEAAPEQALSTLSRCLNACSQGERAINAFCLTIPHPYVKAACWAVSLADYPVCAGFCYNYYGS